MGLIPVAAADRIEREAVADPYDLDELRAGIAASQHPLVPLVRALAERSLERAEVAGGRRVTDPFPIDSGINDGGAAVYLRDPDGYTIELFQAPP
jgi:catechol 2,3-dioxygenase-like lactoylglutathione lyase family enzyme